MQIYDLLKGRIESGFYPPGTQLPKEVDLAVELGVSRVTLRPALELLELERLVRREKGFGTFVRKEQDVKNRVMVLFSAVQDGQESRTEADREFLQNDRPARDFAVRIG